MWAHEIAVATGGELIGPDVSVDGASIDSRDLVDGSLFVPIVDVRDGHDFIELALERGASAFLTQRSLAETPELAQAAMNAGVAAIMVDDTAGAVMALGRAAADRLAHAPGFVGVAGITGSVGKTTTKDQLAASLATTFATAASLRSFNNELGVPLTLINAPDRTVVSVVEMAAKGRGHIALLCDIAQPTIGIVTAIEMVHTEMFGSMSEVAAAKAELVEALPATGTAFLNADDPLVAAMADRTNASVMWWSAAGSPAFIGAPTPDLWASAVTIDDQLHPSFHLHTPWGESDVRLGVRGRHNVGNALAAAGAALALGVTLEGVATGLAGSVMSPWRMDLQTSVGGALILNDSYNAGPASMAAALRALKALDVPSHVAVLGVMAELGDGGIEAHQSIADLANELDIRVIAIDAPNYGPTVEHVADRTAAVELLCATGAPGVGQAILVKGSRVAALEVVAASLLIAT